MSSWYNCSRSSTSSDNKDEVYALYTENDYLEENRVKDTIEYLDDFYELVEDAGDMKREFVRKCRR